MKRLLFFILSLALLASCHTTKKDADAADAGKYLVLYYSQTNATKQVAEDLADLVGADLARFDVAQPYDGSYEETIARCLLEQQGDSLAPLVPLDVDTEEYDVIFLGYPIWFGTYARPVMSLLQTTTFDGKTIVPFCTFGSGGLGSSVAALREACPGAIILDGYGVRAARIDKARAELEQYLINNGFLVGAAEEQVEYSPQEVVSDDERAIFDAACGGYPMPIGTPETVGKKTTATGTDYLFTVASQTPQGDTVQALVYITCEDGNTPVFTRVER